MDISPKELKKLANACRKAGIKHFKSGSIEFTLTDEVPAPGPTRRSRAKANTSAQAAAQADNTPFDSDAPTEEELLFWSSDPMVKTESGDESQGN